jgi:hypothetical protein
MLKIEKTIVDGWEAAIRGMRNPLNSWDKSDTRFNWEVGRIVIGENDLALMKRLSKAGSDHAKFLRMINVTCDITAPLYWWKEYDTYKVGTVANSCSTMHTIHKKPFELSDFSWEHLTEANLKVLEWLIEVLNANREKYNATKNKEDWLQMIQLLPTSFEQKRTVQLNYQVLKNMYHSRKNHKLDEWHVLCAWIEKLPYFMEVCDEQR